VSPVTGSNSGPTRWKPADDGVQVLHAGQALGVTADVDDSRVPAAGEHDQPAPGDAGDQRLILQDQRVGLPALAAPGLVDREALLEAGDPVDLPGDQHRPVVPERRLPLFNDAEVGVFQRVRSTASGGLADPAGTVRRGSLAGPIFLVAFRLFITIDRIVAH
jgi:hypothetical protein